MLYDPQWEEQPPKPQRDIYSLDSLIAWLETKDPKEGYNSL